jgi:hypothetical protein
MDCEKESRDKDTDSRDEISSWDKGYRVQMIYEIQRQGKKIKGFSLNVKIQNCRNNWLHHLSRMEKNYGTPEQA